MNPWPMVTLGEVAQLSRSTVQPDDIKSGTMYIGLEHIESGGQLLDVSPVEAGELASAKFAFGPDHILYGKLRPYLCKIANADFEGVCSTDIIPILPSEVLDKRYLLHFLRQPTMVQLGTTRSTGANLPRLAPSELAKFEIPLPPTEEQRRIAAILDHADALRAKRREALARLDELTQSIFIDMFGNPATNPKGLPVGALGDLLDSAQYGTSEKSGATGEYPVLRMNNITYQGQMDLTDLKFMDLPDDKVDRFTVAAGDILFNRTNSAELVGKTAVYRGSEKLAYAGYLVRLRATSGNSPEYISAFLNSAYGKTVLRGMCKSIVGMANINAREVQSIRMMQPPSKLQEQFADRVNAIEDQKSVQRVALAELDALFASLQSRAFRGEL